MNGFVHTIASTLFTGTFVIFLIVSMALSYHWSHYNMRDPLVPLMQIIYLLGGFVLFGIALVFIL